MGGKSGLLKHTHRAVSVEHVWLLSEQRDGRFSHVSHTQEYSVKKRVYHIIRLDGGLSQG